MPRTASLPEPHGRSWLWRAMEGVSASVARGAYLSRRLRALGTILVSTPGAVLKAMSAKLTKLAEAYRVAALDLARNGSRAEHRAA